MQSVLWLQKGSRPWQQTAALILHWLQSYLSRSIQPHCLSLSLSTPGGSRMLRGLQKMLVIVGLLFSGLCISLSGVRFSNLAG